MRDEEMQYVRYETPDGLEDPIVSGTTTHVTGILFKSEVEIRKPSCACGSVPIPTIQSALNWLDAYFTRAPLPPVPPLDIGGLSPFTRTVLAEVSTIPFGQTLTYGEIAKRLAAQRGGRCVSAQAVGQAVGRNPFCLIIPCHRVLGVHGKLTGYGGGLNNKIALLKHEQIVL